MGLEEIFEPFQEALGGEAVVRFVGPDRADDNSKAPRICWQPLQADHTPPTRIDGGGADSGPFSTRRWEIQVEVWAKNLDELEQLVDLFLATARGLLSKFSFSPGPETWATGGVTAGYMAAKLVVFISRPVLKKPPPIVRLTQIDVVADLGGSSTTTVSITE